MTITILVYKTVSVIFMYKHTHLSIYLHKNIKIRSYLRVALRRRIPAFLAFSHSSKALTHREIISIAAQNSAMTRRYVIF